MEPQTFCLAREFQGAASRKFCEGVEGDPGEEAMAELRAVTARERQSSEIGSFKAAIRKSSVAEFDSTNELMQLSRRRMLKVYIFIQIYILSLLGGY